PRDRTAIFDPFYRVHRAGAPEVPGSGLGLAVARRLTEMMGGRIWAEGVEGANGTLFCIELLGAELDAPA
ncbi:MAG: ATP-binding protein, partial [Chloroflexi bacterium]